MLVFLVTGVSGAGKSSVARRLCQWGHRAVSMDADIRLCAWTSRDGRPVTRPAEPDAAWLAVHHWMWDPRRLDQIIAEAGGEGVEVCGCAATPPTRCSWPTGLTCPFSSTSTSGR